MILDKPNVLDSDVKEAATQLRKAAEAKKCWSCGCLHNTLKAIEQTFDLQRIQPQLSQAAHAAKERLRDVRYDCLGCEVCYISAHNYIY